MIDPGVYVAAVALMYLENRLSDMICLGRQGPYATERKLVKPQVRLQQLSNLSVPLLFECKQ